MKASPLPRRFTGFNPISHGHRQRICWRVKVPPLAAGTISYALPQRQLNFVCGTVGTAPVFRDQIVFVFGDSTTGTVNGDDVVAAGIAFDSNATVEITTTQPFTTAVFTAGAASFEFVPSVPVVLFAGDAGKGSRPAFGPFNGS